MSELLRRLCILLSVCCILAEVDRRAVDKVIETEITYKMADDLIQSVEKKFLVDLERSLDMVTTRIHLLLQNGTQNVQDKFLELLSSFEELNAKAPAKTDLCLQRHHNATTALSEKLLHQMVVCGYALIGQDPLLAVSKIHTLRNMIREEVAPMNSQKSGIYELLRVCGHDHGSLKKVVKCVISKSPIIKSVMMSTSSKLISGIVELTKIIAHGAMHEACLLEVVNTAEDEAERIMEDVKRCVNENKVQNINDSNKSASLKLVTNGMKSKKILDVNNNLNLNFSKNVD